MAEQLPDDMLEHEVTRNVSGVKTQVTVGQLIAEAQKAGAGDQKLRDAHDIQQACAEDTAIRQALQKGIRDKDPAALRLGLQKLGMSPEDIAASVPDPNADPSLLDQAEGLEDDDTGAERATPARKGRQEPPSAASLPTEAIELLKTLAQEVQALKAKTEPMSQAFGQATQKTKQARLQAQIDVELDKHPKFGTMLKSVAPEQAAWLRGEAYRAVGGRVADYPTFGPRTIEAGLTDLAGHLKGIGVGSPGDAGSDESGDLADLCTEDLQLALTVGAGPSSTVGSSGLHRAGGKDEPVRIDDPDYGRKFGQRVIDRQLGKRTMKSRT